MSRLTLANQLTLLRMLLIPVWVILIVYHRFGWGLGVFLLAGVTDGLDGLIARRSGQRTPLGTFLDPMADKLLLSSARVEPARLLATGYVFRFAELDGALRHVLA